jgi:hypothetical protein
VRSTTAGNAAQRHELARVAAERSVTPASSVRVGHEVVRSGDLIAPADLGRMRRAVPRTLPRHATCMYSYMRAPRRSHRTGRAAAPVRGDCDRRAGADGVIQAGGGSWNADRRRSWDQADVSTPTGCRTGADPFTPDTTRRYRVLLDSIFSDHQMARFENDQAGDGVLATFSRVKCYQRRRRI